MRRVLLVAIVVGGCGDDGASGTCPDKGVCTSDAGIEPDGPPLVDPLVGVGTVEVVQGGYMFTEGPQWREAAGDLVFSDIPANTIYRYMPGGGAPTIQRMPSGNANGLAVDGAGAMIAAQHGTRSVTRDGVDLVATYMGNQLNSPNDVIVTSKGTYFTDPPYGLPGGAGNSALGFMGVFFLAKDLTLTAEHQGGMTERPNGIGISPDFLTMYVADTSDGNVYSFAVGTDGHLSNRQVFATTSGNPDGLAIDAAGNVFVATSAGIDVFAPTGTKWGTITVPMQPANCAFGDADHQTLYITARTTLYQVRLANAGLPDH